MEEQLLAQGYRKYAGEAIDVFFHIERCQHSGNCVRGNPAVFEVERKPWIMPDKDEAHRVADVIHTCPSGALKYVLKGEQSNEV